MPLCEYIFVWIHMSRNGLHELLTELQLGGSRRAHNRHWHIFSPVVSHRMPLSLLLYLPTAVNETHLDRNEHETPFFY